MSKSFTPGARVIFHVPAMDIVGNVDSDGDWMAECTDEQFALTGIFSAMYEGDYVGSYDMEEAENNGPKGTSFYEEGKPPISLKPMSARELKKAEAEVIASLMGKT